MLPFCPSLRGEERAGVRGSIEQNDMQTKLAEAEQMTVEEFLAMTDARPDGERWELIEGVAILNASPTQWHQRIASNVIGALDAAKIARDTRWTAAMGVGTHVPISPRSLPQPDVYVKEGDFEDSPTTRDALIIFEVISRANRKAVRDWRKRVYSSVPNCKHYVTIAHKTAEVTRYDREDGWKGITIKGLDASLVLPAIDVSIPLSVIYRWTQIV